MNTILFNLLLILLLSRLVAGFATAVSCLPIHYSFYWGPKTYRTRPRLLLAGHLLGLSLLG